MGMAWAGTEVDAHLGTRAPERDTGTSGKGGGEAGARQRHTYKVRVAQASPELKPRPDTTSEGRSQGPSPRQSLMEQRAGVAPCGPTPG